MPIKLDPQNQPSCYVSKNDFDQFMKPSICKLLKFADSIETIKSLNQSINLRSYTISNIQMQSYKKAVNHVNKNPYKLKEILNTKIEEIEEISKLSSFFQKNTEIDKNRTELWKLYNKNNGSAITYSKFCKLTRMIGLRYRIARKSIDNADINKSKRISLMNFIVNVVSSDSIRYLFFDTTSISKSSFKKSSWQLPNNNKGYKSQFYYNCTHIMMLVSLNELIAFQCIKGNMNSSLVYEFLYEAISKYKNMTNTNRVTVILDNSPLHKTQLIKQLSIENDIEFVFIVPNNPYLT